ncbi:MAG: tetratricopeptide repeat protein [Chloroherpetonaceae bacterium]
MTRTTYKHKITQLLNEAERLKRSEPEKARALATDALECSTSKDFTDGIAKSLILKSDIELLLQRFDDALSTASRVLHLSLPSDSPYRTDALRSIGIAYWKKGEFAKSIEHYKASLSLAVKNKDSMAQLRVLINFSNAYIYLDDYDAALPYLQTASRLAKELNTPDELIQVHNHIGLIHWFQGKDELAAGEFELSLTLAQAHGFENHLHTALNNLGAIYGRKGEREHQRESLLKALDCLEQSLAISDRLGDTTASALAHNNIGNIRKLLDNRDAALFHYQHALQLSKQVGAHYATIESLINLGTFFIEQADLVAAETYLQEALTLSDTVQSDSQRVDILHALTALYKQQRQFEKALDCQETLSLLQQKIFNTEADARLKKLQLSMEIARHLQARQAAEAELQRKQAELNALTLSLVQKGEFIEQILSEVEQSKTEQSPSSSLNNFITKLKNYSPNDNDWKQFQKQFEQLHPDFLHRLLQAYPTLTPTELKICALLKSNLSNKDISKLLYTSIRNVESHRYNIRLKLRLKHKQNLVSFLTQF